MTRLTPKQITQTRELTMRAADCALSFYHDTYEVTIKSDNSPVTQADLAVSELLEKQLPCIADFPVLSEENKTDEPLWKNWETYWLVDPIDGTRHFINGSGEFCICIALIHQNEVIFGLICSPTTNEIWIGQQSETGLATDALIEKYHAGQRIALPQLTCNKVTVTLGNRKVSNRMKTLLSALPEYDFYARGSALKFIDIVEGRANLYPKLWDICEWDCAAGQCLLTCAGGAMIRFDSKAPIRYGEKDGMLSPHFLAYRGLTDEHVEDVRKMYRFVKNL